MHHKKPTPFPGSRGLSKRDQDLTAAIKLGQVLTGSWKEESAMVFRPGLIHALKASHGKGALCASLILSHILYWFVPTDPDRLDSWRTRFFDDQGLPCCTLSHESIAHTFGLSRVSVCRVIAKLKSDGLIVAGFIELGGKTVPTIRPDFSSVNELLSNVGKDAVISRLTAVS